MVGQTTCSLHEILTRLLITENALLKSFINCQIFLPIGHPKSQPFFDRVYTFSLIDDKIWFRHYQVLPEEDGSLAEIGPRFVLNPIKIFDASFSGATLWESPNFTTPAKKRALLKKMKAGKYIRYVFLEYIGFFFWNIFGKLCINQQIHSVSYVYAVLPFYDVKCLCSGGREWRREGSHSH